jgi:hypothetical protein
MRSHWIPQWPLHLRTRVIRRGRNWSDTDGQWAASGGRAGASQGHKGSTATDPGLQTSGLQVCERIDAVCGHLLQQLQKSSTAVVTWCGVLL